MTQVVDDLGKDGVVPVEDEIERVGYGEDDEQVFGDDFGLDAAALLHEDHERDQIAHAAHYDEHGADEHAQLVDHVARHWRRRQRRRHLGTGRCCCCCL